MPQSLSSLLVHLIFSTKNREPCIDDEVEGELHAYLGGIHANLKSPALAIGGMPDHIHILFVLARDVAVADVVQELKRSSSKWIKTKGPRWVDFHWQSGYGAFSIGESQRDVVRRYIGRQREHHRTRTFQDEYRAFLARYGITFDERYVWD